MEINWKNGLKLSGIFLGSLISISILLGLFLFIIGDKYISQNSWLNNLGNLTNLFWIMGISSIIPSFLIGLINNKKVKIPLLVLLALIIIGTIISEIIGVIKINI